MNDTPQMKQFREYVGRKVASGEYASEDDALRAIIGMLEAQEFQQAELRRLIGIGVAQLRAGEYSTRPVEDIVRDVKARMGIE